MPFVDCPICGEITKVYICNRTHTCAACGKVFYMPLCEYDTDESDTFDRHDAAEEKAMHDHDDLNDNGLI